jgi:hypothetical protein
MKGERFPQQYIGSIEVFFRPDQILDSEVVPRLRTCRRIEDGLFEENEIVPPNRNAVEKEERIPGSEHHDGGRAETSGKAEEVHRKEKTEARTRKECEALSHDRSDGHQDIARRSECSEGPDPEDPAARWNHGSQSADVEAECRQGHGPARRIHELREPVGHEGIIGRLVKGQEEEQEVAAQRDACRYQTFVEREVGKRVLGPYDVGIGLNSELRAERRPA